MTDATRTTDSAIRRASSRASRPLLVVFGVGLGIAISLTLVDRPAEVRTELVQSGGGADDLGVTEEVAESSGGATTRRVITQGGTAGQAGSSGDAAAGQATGPAVATNPKDYKCEPGANGGATDDGVNGNSIKVAANVVLDGPGASFLREAVVGIRAVVDEANVKGICGRKIVLTHRNDSWDAATGLQYIENYVNDKTFALVVNPSSEGLDNAVKNGTIDRAGIPVIGTDGMLISQYRWPEDGSGPGQAKWLWPVAASTISTMHIIVQHAHDQGARSFGLIYDKFYKFGPEGEKAFKGAAERLCGGCTVYTQGIDPGKTTYTNEANTFNGQCGPDGPDAKCDLVAMLLDPATAITWIKSGGAFGAKLTAGPQTLFNRDFAVNCVQERNKLDKGCDLVVWTGYNPPVDELANLPGVAKYVSDVKSRNAQADVENSFTEGAYLGARVFVEALTRVGPNLTRENLQSVMDTMTYASDLTNELKWTSGSHFANTAMQGFRVGYTANGFTGWQNERTGWVKDKWVGEY